MTVGKNKEFFCLFKFTSELIPETIVAMSLFSLIGKFSLKYKHTPSFLLLPGLYAQGSGEWPLI